uniref:LEM domain-containing protein n=1 Tax=Caenorhabditis tropicalis TaxID=1561998 RepID=A0A1I7TFY8_9PELO
MASTSIKSAVARMSSLNYAELEELKKVTIPRAEQEDVLKELNKTKKKDGASLPRDNKTCLEMFETGVGLKRIRIPKREQRYVQIVIDELNAQK